MNRLQHSSDGLALGKDQMHRLLDALKEYGELIGPVHDGQWLRMQTFSKYEELCLKGISWFTSKEYFFPQRQVLFQFDGHSLTRQEEFPKRVLFGLRLCDLNAIAVNDKLFLEQEPQHREYKGYREGLTLVGLWCDEVQDKYCFCSSMELEHFYDICLYDRGDYYHIKAGSEKGQEILEKLQLLPNGPYEKEFPTGEMKLSTKDIAKFFDKNQVWQKGAKECLSCGDCTTLCPTCMCFDVQDEVEVDLTKGFRIQKWDSCMYKDFTLVAGGHVYRNTRLNRFKHRIYHKLVYFPQKFERYMCTGCGRCIRGCPTKIDWIGLVNEMEGETQ